MSLPLCFSLAWAVSVLDWPSWSCVNVPDHFPVTSASSATADNTKQQISFFIDSSFSYGSCAVEGTDVTGGPKVRKKITFPSHAPQRAVSGLRRWQGSNRAPPSRLPSTRSTDRDRAGSHSENTLELGSQGHQPLRYNVSQRGLSYGDDDGPRSSRSEDKAEGREDIGRDGYLGVRCRAHVARPCGRREGPAFRG